jgi:hypothetical protein
MVFIRVGTPLDVPVEHCYGMGHVQRDLESILDRGRRPRTMASSARIAVTHTRSGSLLGQLLMKHHALFS